MMRTLGLAVLSLVLFSMRLSAMEFHIVRFDHEKVNAIAANGYVISGDLKRLRSAMTKATRNKNGRFVILLNSLGGQAGEAFRLARLIRAEKFVAVVPPGFNCASACSSIVYFAADHFYTLGTGKLGFHSCSQGRKRSDLCNQFILDHASEHGIDRNKLSKLLSEVSPRKILWFRGREACKKGFCNLLKRVPENSAPGDQKLWSPGTMSFAIRKTHQAECQAFYEVNSNLRFGLIHGQRYGWRLIVQSEKLRVNLRGAQQVRVSVGSSMPSWIQVRTVRARNITEFEINKFDLLLNSLVASSAITYHFDHRDRGTIPIPALRQGIKIIRTCIENQAS